MRYVQRDKDGNIIGHYAHQHDYAQEEVPDDHPDILAWKAKRKADKDAHMEEKALMREMLAAYKSQKEKR